MAPKISVAINTLNEERRLPLALRSVAPWADEIVVVDMHSDDRTAEVARSFGAQVHLHERARFVEPARAFALSRCSGDWILILDADELIPAPLSARLREIAAGDAADAVRIPRLNYLLGAPIHHGRWGREQDRQLRFFRRGRLVLPTEIHGPLAAAPGARTLDLPAAPGHAIVHFNYLDASDFLERLDRYTTIEAEAAQRRGEPGGDARTALRAGYEFLTRYFRHGAVRDGWRGWYLSLFMALYRLATGAKRHEIGAGLTREVIEARYRKVAEEMIEGHRALTLTSPIGPETSAPKISVAINTLNEAARLPLAARSVAGWTDELVVVDMHSDDGTGEVARSLGARVHLHERTGFVESARAAAVERCSGDWILILDADEVVPAPLAHRLRAIAARGQADGVAIPWLNYMLGSPLFHAGWGPNQDRHLRFFRKGAVDLSPDIHRPLALRRGLRTLRLSYAPGEAVAHFSHRDTADFLERLNRYTTIEAHQARARGERASEARAVARAAYEWVVRYVWFAGFRAGWRGWYLSAFMAFYRLAIGAKLREIEAGATRDEVDQRYREVAEALLLEYPPATTEPSRR